MKNMCLVIVIWLLTGQAIVADPVIDPIADVKNWRTEGLPVFANWNTGGFTFDWHIDQLRVNGHRIIPTFKLPILTDDEFKNSSMPITKAENKAFLRDNNIPLCLRTDQIGQCIARLPRVPKTLESVPDSAVVMTLTGGMIGDEALPDVFGPIQKWSDMGVRWAQMKIVKEVTTLYPNPSFWILADNNESHRDKKDRYWNTQKTTINGRVVDVQTDNGDFLYEWKPLDVLETLSLRTKWFAESHTIQEYSQISNANCNALYNAAYAGFESALPSSWQGKMLTEGYAVGVFTMHGDIDFSSQYDYQFNHFDGGGSSLYINGDGDSQWDGRTTLSDFTSPAWFRVYHLTPSAERAELFNPAHYREVFLMMNGQGVYAGAVRGRHEVATPDFYTGQLQWVLWAIRGDRKPVMFRYWIGSQTGPTTPFYSTDAAKKIVSDLGYPEIANGTQSLYIDAAMAAVDAVCNQKTIRKFYQDGESLVTGTHPEFEIKWKSGATPVVYPVDGPNKSWRLLNCNLNTPRVQWVVQPGPNNRGGYSRDMQIKVWGNAVKLDNDYLIYLWTPCKLDGMLEVEVPGMGVFTTEVPTTNGKYVVIHKGSLMTIPEYEIAIAKTPFDLWYEGLGLETKGVTKEFAEQYFRILEATKESK